MDIIVCSICAGRHFRELPVIWDDLASEWQLSATERGYVDRQQGCHCVACGANLRIVALGNAVRGAIGTSLALRDVIAAGSLIDCHILDCNGAAGISAELSSLPKYFRADYPEYDMHNLPFADGSFDLVIHSDTLEHVGNPVVALEECRRILKPSGHLCFTVPIIVGRLSRSRAGLAPSYHGNPSTAEADLIVQTEFGANAWTIVFEAGFTNMSFTQVEYPSGLAITAWMDVPPSVEGN